MALSVLEGWKSGPIIHSSGRRDAPCDSASLVKFPWQKNQEMIKWILSSNKIYCQGKHIQQNRWVLARGENFCSATHAAGMTPHAKIIIMATLLVRMSPCQVETDDT